MPSARLRKSRDKASANRVGGYCKHDWDKLCRLPYCRHRTDSRSHDHVNLAPNELGGDLGKAFGATFRPTRFNDDRATVIPTELAEPFDKSVDS